MKPDFEKIANDLSWMSNHQQVETLNNLYLAGRKAQVKDCAALVKSWHYKKGGYETLAKAIESQELL